MKKTTLLIVFILSSLITFSQKKNYVITSYGAKADGTTLNTQSIQNAIDAASENGGGTVIIPDGKFLTSSIILKSGVELHLSDNAVLLGSTNPYDYPFIKEVLIKNFPQNESLGAVIEAQGQSNISITGKGTINGQGRKLALRLDSLYYAGILEAKYYNLRRKRPERRPNDLNFFQCKNVLISGVTIKNSCSWVQKYTQCDKVVIDNIKVESDAYWNNDGIDIVDCHNVRITNSFVNASDDGICLKSATAGYLDDSIYIANCTVRSSASAVKFGTGSVGGFRNVVIKNIKVYDTFRSAIAIESVDGGILENILVDGITATNTGNAIFIRLGHRNKDSHVGNLHDVIIKNVKVQIPFGRPDKNYDVRGPDLPFFHNTFPASIVGIPGHDVENILLENIEIDYPGKGNDGLAVLPLFRLETVPEVEKEYPEFSMFAELPAWGFYVRHVKNLTMKNISIKAREKDYRPACVFDDVNGLTLANFKVQENDNGKQFILKDVTGAHLKVDSSLVKVMK